MTNISNYILPIIVLFITTYGIVKKHPIYDYFIEGAKEGLEISISLLPYLLSMIFAVNIFIDSNILNIIFNYINPLLKTLNIPIETIPLFFLKPLSSSASLAYVTSIISNLGVDSLIATICATIQGSTDTTIYIITMYFGSIGIKKIKYALRVSLLADVFGILISIFLVNYFF